MSVLNVFDLATHFSSVSISTMSLQVAANLSRVLKLSSTCVSILPYTERLGEGRTEEVSPWGIVYFVVCAFVLIHLLPCRKSRKNYPPATHAAFCMV